MSAELHALRWGNGPPLALLHGWGMHAGLFSRLAGWLSIDHRVAAIDLPGHGGSVGRGSLGSLDAASDAVAAVLDPGSALVGWSLGGLVALAVAWRHPGRVSRVILVSATPRFTRRNGWPNAVDPQVLESFAQDLEGRYRETLTRFLALQFHGVPGAAAALRPIREQVLACSPDPTVLRQGLERLRDEDLRAVLAELRCPVHAVLGGRDRLVPAAVADDLLALRPSMTVRVMAAAGHAPFLSHPESFERTLRELLYG
jgi:pimeloyl-[acyl-carrier protein] methyl ester esterase